MRVGDPGQRAGRRAVGQVAAGHGAVRPPPDAGRARCRRSRPAAPRRRCRARGRVELGVGHRQLQRVPDRHPGCGCRRAPGSSAGMGAQLGRQHDLRPGLVRGVGQHQRRAGRPVERRSGRRRPRRRTRASLGAVGAERRHRRPRACAAVSPAAGAHAASRRRRAASSSPVVRSQASAHASRSAAPAAGPRGEQVGELGVAVGVRARCSRAARRGTRRRRAVQRELAQHRRALRVGDPVEVGERARGVRRRRCRRPGAWTAAGRRRNPHALRAMPKSTQACSPIDRGGRGTRRTTR